MSRVAQGLLNWNTGIDNLRRQIGGTHKHAILITLLVTQLWQKIPFGFTKIRGFFIFFSRAKLCQNKMIPAMA